VPSWCRGRGSLLVGGVKGFMRSALEKGSRLKNIFFWRQRRGGGEANFSTYYGGVVVSCAYYIREGDPPSVKTHV